MDPLYPLSFTLNGKQVEQEVSTRTSLADMLRIQMGLTATHLGCEQGSYGACTVVVDGKMVRSCLIFAIQLESAVIETSEGFAGDAMMDALRHNFAGRNALQCGFCTGGMLIAAHDLLQANPKPDRATIREKISGNFCRCTGYEAIVDAIWKTAQEAGNEE
ncbi:MAG: (2Fe-2S)-binding protein [Marinosulfonomonas sp.]|nr:MAG: (2Fe-2S)-binding protein [Marinosulfonomonas sp.]